MWEKHDPICGVSWWMDGRQYIIPYICEVPRELVVDDTIQFSYCLKMSFSKLILITGKVGPIIYSYLCVSVGAIE